MHPRLQRLEVRPPVDERDDLAIEQRLLVPDGVTQPGDFRGGGGDVLAGPGEQPEAAVLDEGERAYAVPLHLHCPFLAVVAWLLTRRGEHGGERGGQREPLAV